MLEKDIPPKWMWSLDEELSDHFRKIRERDGSAFDDDDDDEPTGPMAQNDLAKNRGRNAR